MLCPACAQETIEEIESRCYLCNKLTKQNRVCTSCKGRTSLRRVWWLGSYKDVLKELILQLKFQRKRAYAREFGMYLAQALPYLPEDTIVVSVPTASKRIRARGYDQAALIAAAFARKKGLVYKNILVRTSQVDQIGKDRTSRIKQMRDSIRMDTGAHIRGTTVLLIDDVLTTGASLEAAARLLRAQGAKHVDAAIIARHMLT